VRISLCKSFITMPVGVCVWEQGLCLCKIKRGANNLSNIQFEHVVVPEASPEVTVLLRVLRAATLLTDKTRTVLSKLSSTSFLFQLYRASAAIAVLLLALVKCCCCSIPWYCLQVNWPTKSRAHRLHCSCWHSYEFNIGFRLLGLQQTICRPVSHAHTFHSTVCMPGLCQAGAEVQAVSSPRAGNCWISWAERHQACDINHCPAHGLLTACNSATWHAPDRVVACRVWHPAEFGTRAAEYLKSCPCLS
jgi:hypothetical protein